MLSEVIAQAAQQETRERVLATLGEGVEISDREVERWLRKLGAAWWRDRSTPRELLAKTRRSNTVDATVVASAAERGDLVVTGDVHDLRELARQVRGVDVEGLK